MARHLARCRRVDRGGDRRRSPPGDRRLRRNGDDGWRVDAVERFDPSAAEIVALCDTRAPFEQAPQIFGPQKGAGPGLVARLAARALPRDPTGVPMSGAGGGLSGALWAHGATLVRGAPFILDAVGFDRRAWAAGCVITGEGRLDATTLTGKTVEEVASRCRRLGVPCHAIVGTSSLEPSQIEPLGLASIHEATDLPAITAAAAAVAIGTGG